MTAQAIATLAPADLCIRMDRPLIGPERLIFAPVTTRAIRAIAAFERGQDAETDRRTGFAWASVSRDPYDEAACKLWLDIRVGLPTAQDMLIARFGDPDRWRGWGEDFANDAWAHDPARLLPEWFEERAA